MSLGLYIYINIHFLLLYWFFADSPSCLLCVYWGKRLKLWFNVAYIHDAFRQSNAEAMCHCLEISRGQDRRGSAWDVEISINLADHRGLSNNQGGDLRFEWIWDFEVCEKFPGLVKSLWFAQKFDVKQLNEDMHFHTMASCIESFSSGKMISSHPSSWHPLAGGYMYIYIYMHNS